MLEANLIDTLLWQPTAVLTYLELSKEANPISIGQENPSRHAADEYVKVKCSQDKKKIDVWKLLLFNILPTAQHTGRKHCQAITNNVVTWNFGAL